MNLNIDSFYKAGAYASLYKSYGEVVDARPAEDVTVSIIREKKPVGLFSYFETHNIRVTNPYSGIYYMLDAVLFPTQIVVTKKFKRELADSVLEVSIQANKDIVNELKGESLLKKAAAFFAEEID